MREAIKKNKKIIIIAIAIIVLLLIGIAFAYLTTTIFGEKEYIVRAGSLGLILEEDNELTLEKQIPIEDSLGMSLTGFDFRLINQGKIDTDYTIYLDDIPLEEGETRMPDSAIRYSLTRDNVVGNADDLTNMGTNPNRVVDTGTIEPDQTINYTLRIWIDYDATTEEASGKTFKGKLRVVAKQSVGEKASTVLLENIPKENQYDDETDTFITGEDPNNYIWYSGKLWRAVSVNNEAKTVKLVTQWNVSTNNYDDDSSAFEGSYMKIWLNDTSVDGFLGNLREPEKFIKMDSQWTDYNSSYKPNDDPDASLIESPVGLLNLYEYITSYNGIDYSAGYLNNSTEWYLITTALDDYIRYVLDDGSNDSTYRKFLGVRPSINLKASVYVIDGDGTMNNPYRLKGDNDTNLSGTKLNTRYSGEYITFGIGENNLYRIVSHETSGLTKITSDEPLKENSAFKTLAFGDNNIYSSTNTIGRFLNGDYLTNYVGSNYSNMIENSTTWYLGSLANDSNYKLTKYTNATDNILISNITGAKVGLLRVGELMAGIFDTYSEDMGFSYYLLTPYLSDSGSSEEILGVDDHSEVYNMYVLDDSIAIKPALNLKSNVVITGGAGTKSDPFQIELAS